MLILDDIGAAVEDKEWIRNSIFRLVNRRHENLLPTIYTSNVPIDKLKCGERVTSRIYEDSFQLSMPEISIRMKKADISKAESVVCMGISEFGEEHDKRLDVLVGLERAAFMAGANMVLDFIFGKERM